MGEALVLDGLAEGLAELEDVEGLADSLALEDSLFEEPPSDTLADPQAARKAAPPKPKTPRAARRLINEDISSTHFGIVTTVQTRAKD